VFLLRHGRPLKRIHDLEVLLNEAVPIDASLEAYRGILQEISAYYIVERYPMLPSREIYCGRRKKCFRKAPSVFQTYATRIR
jgi:HEPN domain-containing protein